MDNSILNHVGSRIRLYRKSRGMTSEQLAAAIGKSKATVSKYESGHIAPDIAALWDMAAALGVAPAQFFEGMRPDTADPVAVRSPFGECSRLYVYHLTGGELHRSALHLSFSESGADATLFYKLHEGADEGQCDCIYHGHMYCHDVVVAFVMQNYNNPVENMLMNFNIPLHHSRALFGMMCGLSGNTMAPVALKAALSEQPLALDEALRAQLTLTPAAFREMQRNNMLFIPLE